MSISPDPKPNFPERRAAATPRQQLELWAQEWSARWESRVRVNATLVGLAALAFLIWSSNVPLHVAVVLCAATLVAISLSKRRFFPIPWMLLLIATVSVAENVQLRMVYDIIFAGDIVAALALLLVVACMLQQLEMNAKGFQRWRLTGRGGDVPVDGSASLESHGNGRVRVDYWSFVRLLIGFALAWLMLSIWSIEDFSRNRFRFDAPVYRLVVIAWALTMALVIPMTVLSILRWRRLTPDQAELYMRKTYAEVADSEHRMLEKARSKWERTGRA